MKTWQKMGLVTLAVIGIAAAGTQRTPLNRAFLQSHLDANNFNVTNLQGGVPGMVVAYNGDNGLMPTSVISVSTNYVTNLFSSTNYFNDVTVTNGITNLSLTANTVLKADANSQISSIPNGTGALTNDGAGNFGWNTSISGASGPWTNSADFTWLSGFTMATNGAPQTAPFSIWTNASFFVGPDVFQDIAQDPTTVHFPYAVLLTDSNGPNAIQFSFNVYDSLAGSAFSKWFSTVSPSQSSATYENSIHNDKLSWRMQTVSEFDFSTNTVSIFHIDNEGLTTANGYVDTSGNVGDLVAYGTAGRLVSTNVTAIISGLTNIQQNFATTNNSSTLTNIISSIASNAVPVQTNFNLLAVTNLFAGTIVATNGYFTNLTVGTLYSATNFFGQVTITNNIDFLTNASTMAPDFSKAYAAITTNASFSFLSPINVDPTKTKVQTAVVRVDNSSGSALVVTPPAGVIVISNSFMGVGANGTTWFTFVSYPPDRTNVYANAETH